MKSEISYYDEISSFLNEKFKLFFKKDGKIIVSFIPLGSITLKNAIFHEIKRLNIKDKHFLKKIDLTDGLQVDIAGIIHEIGKKTLLIIIEVKLGGLNLTHLSQLAGYCIYSETTRGILLSVNGNPSKNFIELLQHKPKKLIIKATENTKMNKYRFSIGQWNTKKKEIIMFSLRNNPANLSSFMRGCLLELKK